MHAALPNFDSQDKAITTVVIREQIRLKDALKQKDLTRVVSKSSLVTLDEVWYEQVRFKFGLAVR